MCWKRTCHLWRHSKAPLWPWLRSSCPRCCTRSHRRTWGRSCWAERSKPTLKMPFCSPTLNRTRTYTDPFQVTHSHASGGTYGPSGDGALEIRCGMSTRQDFLTYKVERRTLHRGVGNLLASEEVISPGKSPSRASTIACDCSSAAKRVA